MLPLLRNSAFKGCWVRDTVIMAIAAQKADKVGDRRSSMMHQIRITIGSRK